MPQSVRKRMYCARFLLTVIPALSPFAVHAQDAADDEFGRRIFNTAKPPCSLCHTLADANATGKIGPNLDKQKPTEQRVRIAVSGGVGVMPAYGDKLSEEEIDAVSEYVAMAAGRKAGRDADRARARPAPDPTGQDRRRSRDSR